MEHFEYTTQCNYPLNTSYQDGVYKMKRKQQQAHNNALSIKWKPQHHLKLKHSTNDSLSQENGLSQMLVAVGY